MQALFLNSKKNPSIKRGDIVLPIRNWQTAIMALRILRMNEKNTKGKPKNFLTLITLPDNHPVHLIIGKPKIKRNELDFISLKDFSREDSDLLKESFSYLQGEQAIIDTSSIGWIARLVLGESIPMKNIKWTKDMRLLEKGERYRNNKRKQS